MYHVPNVDAWVGGERRRVAAITFPGGWLQMPIFRYGRWDNSQEPFGAQPEDLMEAISDDLATHGDINRALRRMMMRGFEMRDGQNVEGIRQMTERLRQQRQDHLDRYDLNSVMDGIREKLQEIRDLERDTLEQRMQDAQDAMRDAPASQQDGGNAPSESQSGQNPQQDGDNSQSGSPRQEAEEELKRFLEQLERELNSGGQQGQESQDGSESGQQDGQQPGGQQGDQQQGAGQRSQRGAGMDRMTAQALENMAQRKMDFMESLPNDPGGAIKELSDYDFMDEEAREKFKELLDSLRQQASQSYMQNMMQQMQNITPEQMAATREMMRDLNEMLRDYSQGNQPNFDEFMQKWGNMFGDNPPRDIEELLERLMEQMSQFQSLMDSLPEEMRQQLQETMAAALNDPEMMQEMAQLSSLMESLMPMQEMRQNYPFSGDESLSLQEAMRLMDQLQQIDDLEAQLRAAERRGDIDNIDREQVENLIGEDAARDLDWLRELQEQLEKAGYIRQNGDKLELTPRGIRKIGEKALKDIFSKLRGASLGAHEMQKNGLFGEKDEESTKIYEFGDHFDVHMTRTVKNAVMRNGPGTPLKIAPDDFEVYRDETLTQASTVILLDQSRSMAISGSFDAAKRMALALHTLIKMQFPRDNLYVVGFADYAWELKGDELIKATWGGYSPGTNMQHALMISRNLLAKHRSSTRQVIMVTDGEPTAHLEGGAPYFTYPPSQRTIDMTLREVKRCTQEGITINVFMLEMAYYLVNFVRQMTQLNRGRAFFTQPDKLGQYVLVDYLNNKRGAIAP